MLELAVMTDRMSPHEWLMKDFERRSRSWTRRGVFTREFMELIDDTAPVHTSRQMRWVPGLQLQLGDDPAQPYEFCPVVDAGVAP